MAEDPLWPRASSWLQPAGSEKAEIGLFGVLASETSISATGANATPAEIRVALARYSTCSHSQNHDLRQLSFLDFGDSETPDSKDGEESQEDTDSKVDDIFS